MTESVSYGLLRIVKDTMQEAEELGGLEGDEYLTFMRSIEVEARNRQDSYYRARVAKYASEDRDKGRDEVNTFVSEEIGRLCEKYYNTPAHDALMELSERLGYTPPSSHAVKVPSEVVAEATKRINLILGDGVAVHDDFQDTVTINLCNMSTKMNDHLKLLIWGTVDGTWAATCYRDSSMEVVMEDECIETTLSGDCADPRRIAKTILLETMHWVDRPAPPTRLKQGIDN